MKESPCSREKARPRDDPIPARWYPFMGADDSRSFLAWRLPGRSTPRGEAKMISSRMFQVPFWGLLLAGLAMAPGPQQKEAPKPAAESPSLPELRIKAAAKQYELVWQYYQQNRVDTARCLSLVATASGLPASDQQSPGRSDPELRGASRPHEEAGSPHQEDQAPRFRTNQRRRGLGVFPDRGGVMAGRARSK